MGLRHQQPRNQHERARGRRQNAELLQKAAGVACATRSAGTGDSLRHSVEAASFPTPAHPLRPEPATAHVLYRPPIVTLLLLTLAQRQNVMNTFNRRWIFWQSRSSTFRLGITFAGRDALFVGVQLGCTRRLVFETLLFVILRKLNKEFNNTVFVYFK